MTKYAFAVVLFVVSIFSYSDELEIPSEFRLLIDREHELYDIAIPHPCGASIAFYGRQLPYENKMFYVDFAYEFDDANKIIAKWPLPLDAFPTGIKGERLTVLIQGTNEYIYIWKNGKINLALDVEKEKGVSKECPDIKNIPGKSSDYFCTTVVDKGSAKKRMLATLPVCT